MGERLICLGNPRCTEKLFEGWQETLIWSALEGEMGRVWALNDQPSAALCETGDFLFLAGAANESETRALLEAWCAEKSDFRILVPADGTCRALIETIFGTRARPGERYAIRKGGEQFDPVRLQKLTENLPEGVSVVPFDGALYREALRHDWTRDFVSQFRDEADYLRRGLGFAAVHNGEMIGGASSYTVYSKGIEIQVEVRSDWRRKGIASACCAALILECLKRGLYPSWDASNPVSVALAQKLGYQPANPYPVWFID